MDSEEVEKIVHSYGRIIEEVFKQPLVLYHYPTLHFPQSLLPYPKPKIKKALEQAIKYSERKGDKEMVKTLKDTLSYLDSFIDDYKAYEKNNKILNKKGYWDSLKEKIGKVSR